MTRKTCPLCGEKPRFYLRRGWTCCGFWGTTERDWNRVARLVRKGRMFEWLERLMPGTEQTVGMAIRDARSWWRKRGAKK